LNTINNTRGYFDIIFDDRGHKMTQQITSFSHLVAKVRSGGVYVIEDLQTNSSYVAGADSVYLVKSKIIELIKRLVDDVQVDSPQN
jgi:demethylmacrocin O-methyltransferase